MDPHGNEVLIRMYGQGVGDCFLLAFPREGGSETERPVYVLIDCGVIPQTPGGGDRMRAVVSEIRKTTRDDDLDPIDGEPAGHLDLLVLTHEHMDHLSGFLEARDEWEKIKVDQTWMAWTENEEDRLPNALKTLRDRQLRALVEVANRAERFGLDDLKNTVVSHLAFEGNIVKTPFGFDFSETTSKALNAAKSKSPEDAICCEPGDVRRVPGTKSMAYVLGPPRDQEFLSRPNPSTVHPETYEAEERQTLRQREGSDPALSLRARSSRGSGMALNQMVEGRSPFNAFALPLIHQLHVDDEHANGRSLDDPSLAEEDLFYRSFPFGPQVRVPITRAEASVTDQPNAFPGFDSYYAEDERWRRIDFDWLMTAESFAIQLGDLTNNSSLVLAFELPAAGPDKEQKVLLFVADAMVGNWLSWDIIEQWQPKGDAEASQPKPDIDDLLKRTVFYKVGHHGSHNATLKARGLERMSSGNKLTAFVPVNPRVARDIKNWCDMPLDVLMNALAERTGGRVILSNGNVWPPIDDPEKLAKKLVSTKVMVSEKTLPAMVRSKTGEVIQPEYPMWAQIGVKY